MADTQYTTETRKDGNGNPYEVRIPVGSTPTPAPTTPAPTSNPTPTASVPSPYSSNTGFTTRMDYSTDPNGVKIQVDPATGKDITGQNSPNQINRPIYNEEPTVTQAKSEQEIQAEKAKASQAEIDNLNKYYDTLKNEQQITNEGNTRSTNAISALTGLSGSSEANVANNTTTTKNTQALAKVENERSVAVNAILSGIRTSAVEEARQQRLDQRQSEQDRIAYREKAQTNAVATLTSLSKSESGATLEGLKKTLSPEEYDTLIKNAGGELLAKSILFENRPKNTIVGTPTLVGNHVVQYYTTPAGKIVSENVELPEGVNPTNIKSIEKTDNGLFIINNDGTWATVTGSAKPGTATPENYNNEFAATIDTVANMEPTVANRAAVKSQLQSLIANKDYTSAYNTIANQVENGLTGSSKQRFADSRTDYEVMKGLKTAIDAYAAGGGDMGLLTGTEEQIKRKLGIDSGKASELGTQLWREFQTYRNTMTGAAFGAAESRDYASVNPTLGKSLDLNTSVITGALNQLDNRITGTINSRVPSAKSIKEYADNPSLSNQGNTDNPNQKTDTNGVKYEKVEGGWKKVSFNSEGSVSNNANRPQRNNNPLNLKESKFTKTFSGVSGTDPSPASDGGKFLTFNSPEAGFEGAKQLLSSTVYSNLSVDQALKKWSNGGYGAEIVPSLKNKTINSLSDAELLQIIQTMARREGYYA
jgi:hypothetical protein